MDTSAYLWIREYLFPLSYFLRLLRDLSQLIPANRPGVVVARWLVNSRTDELRLEIFQEALIESGLLEAIVLSIVLIRSGHSLGNPIDLSDPRFTSRSLFRIA